MARPFTRAQALQNRFFLDGLAQTGNSRLAARAIGMAHSTLHDRRSKHAGFAQAWDAALAAAHARFHLSGGKRGPEDLDMMEAPSCRGGRGREGERERRKVDCLRPSSTPSLRRNDGKRGRGLLDFARSERGLLRTRGGEAVVVRTRSGKLQLRLAHSNKLTHAAEQAFLAALSATANVRLSAAAAGASARAFYRRRQQNPGFAREMRMALQMGYDRLEAAALLAALPESRADDDWRHNSPPPIPPMTAGQALQLLCLHEKSVRQRWSQPHRRRRRNESDERYRMRLFLMWRAEQRQIAEERAVARAEHYEETGDWRLEEEAPPIALPPLHLVTGWSRADPAKKPHDPDLALFGGWRIEEMEKSRGR